MNMYICPAPFSFSNKINTTKTESIRKASDHNNMGMLSRKLQICTLVTSRHVYLYGILFNRLLKSKQLYSIKHEKQCQCLVISETQLYFLLWSGYPECSCFHLWRSYLDGLIQTKCERRRSLNAHLLLRYHHVPIVVRRCFAAGANFSWEFTLASHFGLPKQTSFWP